MNEIERVQAKLHTCSELDQLTRNFSLTPDIDGYSEEERNRFWSKYSKIWDQVDVQNTAHLKEIIKDKGWINISIFGLEAERDAWLIVQHADHDPQFQKEVLEKLKAFGALGESDPANFAYLYDRVAVSGLEAGTKLQRFGTQGHYVGYSWEPYPVEEPAKLDERRSKVGLEPMCEYRKAFPSLAL